MEFQADELERLVNTGQLSGTILPIAESVAIILKRKMGAVIYC